MPRRQMIKKAQEVKKKQTPKEWATGLSDEELLKKHRHLRDMNREHLFPETANALIKEMKKRNLKPLKKRTVDEEIRERW